MNFNYNSKCWELKVSVSYRSYILSYLQLIKYININVYLCFRLLSELYSLLLELDGIYKTENMFPSPIGVIFSLIFGNYTKYARILPVSVSYRSYILSYQKNIAKTNRISNIRFPSPIGVIFSLMRIK